MRIYILAVFFAAFLGGCDFDHPICDREWRPGIVVNVYDAVTGEPIAADALGIASEGTYTDTLTVRRIDTEGRSTSLAGVHERPGRYDVTVQQDGYAPWQRSGVLVHPGECHAQTAELEAHLEPASS